MRALKLMALGLALFLSSCGAPNITPVTPSAIVSITATLPLIATLAPPTAMPPPATITPAPSIEPSATASPSPRSAPTASPRPKITATPQPITITLFTIEPSTIDPGDSFTITWRATGGEVYLIPINQLGQYTPGTPEPISGSLVVTTDKSQRNFMQFVLSVHDLYRDKYIQAGASVTLRCPDVWFFPDGPASCPQSTPSAGNAAIQHFEHGIMIWLQPRNSIFVLYADNQYSPKWDWRQDNYIDGQPESDPALVPPTGKFQPIRGFGLVWRDDENQPVIRVRDRLGWAIDEEEPFQGALQCNSAIKYTTCYLKDDRGRTIELRPERSAWSYWGQ